MENNDILIKPKEAQGTPNWISIICLVNFLYLGYNLFGIIMLAPLVDSKILVYFLIFLSVAGLISNAGLLVMKRWALYAYTIVWVTNLITSFTMGGPNPLSFLMSIFVLSVIWSYEKKMTGKNNTSEKKKTDETDITISEIPCDPISTYSASEIKSQINSPKSSFFGGSDENIQVEFADGVKGSIFYIPSKNEYYFNEKSKWGISNHYDNFNNCTNAMHYFKTEGRVLKLGHLGTYS